MTKQARLIQSNSLKMSSSWWIFFIVIAILLYKYFSRNVNYWRDRGVVGPPSIALFGNILDNFKTSINDLEIERAEKYGKIYGFLEMTQPVISISDVELLKLLAIKDFHIFTNHNNLSPADPLLSLMLVNAQDNEWKRHKNVSKPAFTIPKIKQLFPAVNQCVENTLTYFDEVAKYSKEIDLKKTMLSYTVDTIVSSVFGLEINCYKNPDGVAVRHAYKLSDFSTIRVMLGFLLPSKIRQLFGFQLFNPSSVAYFKNVLNIAVHNNREAERMNNFISLLLKAEINDSTELQKFTDEGFSYADVLDVKNDTRYHKRTLTKDEILAQCMFIFIAGAETPSTCLQMLTYTLAVKPEIQEKLYTEIKNYIESEMYTHVSLISLPYLDCVVNETLRKFSPVCHFDRVCISDYKLGDTGIVIPKGTIVNVPFYAVHHDPDYWEDPFEFKPERFLPENKHLIKPYTFLPFGIGPRTCLGMKFAVTEIKALVAKLVYNFEIVKTKNTAAEPVFTGKKYLHSTKPLLVTLKRRQSRNTNINYK